MKTSFIVVQLIQRGAFSRDRQIVSSHFSDHVIIEGARNVALLNLGILVTVKNMII